MKLSTQIIDHLKKSAPFMQYVEGHESRRMLRHALGLPDDSKPRTERIAKEKGLPLYARKIEGEKPLGSFAEMHAEKMLYDAVEDIRKQGTIAALKMGVPVRSGEWDGYFTLDDGQLTFSEE